MFEIVKKIAFENRKDSLKRTNGCLGRFFFENFLEFFQEEVGVLGLEDEGGTEPDGSFAAAAAVDALQPEVADDLVASKNKQIGIFLNSLY